LVTDHGTWHSCAAGTTEEPRHLIFAPAIGTSEDDHRFIMRLPLMM
jgi:hypothetical protein